MHPTPYCRGRLILSFALACVSVPVCGASFTVGPSGSGCALPSIVDALAAAAANGTEADYIYPQADFTEVLAGPLIVDLDATGNLSISGGSPCWGGPSYWVSNLRFTSGSGFIVTGGASTQRSFGMANMNLAPSDGSSGVGRMLDLSGRVTAGCSRCTLVGGTDTEGGVLRITGPFASLVFAGFPSTVSGGSVTGDGGGILVDGATFALGLMTVSGNHADGRGGGIACRGGGHLLDARTEGNTAGSGGGGIAADDCTVELSGFVRQNHADGAPGEGGGIYASGGATVIVSGFASTPQTEWLRENTAVRGGALFATGVGTTVTFANAGVVENSASEGGAIAVEGGAQISVLQSRVARNSATAGSAVLVSGSGSSLLLESSLLGANTGGTLVAVADGGHVTAALTTAVANDLGGGPALTVTGTGSSLELFSSVMVDARVFDPPAAGTTREADCVVALDFTDFPVEPRAGSYVQVASAGEVLFGIDGSSPALRYDGPAIDFCDGLNYLPTGPDYDGDFRPFDQPPAGSTQFGILDAGADESHAIFQANLEAGDCSEWSFSIGCP